MSTKYVTPALVTLTGVSNDTDIEKLFEVSKQFPFVEWAILYSHDRTGNDPRYPSRSWIERFFKAAYFDNDDQINFAIHLCGSAVTSFVHDDQDINFLYKYMMSRRMRVQLNFNLKWATFTVKNLCKRIEATTTNVPVITQHNEANKELVEHVFATNHQVLFDSSGGRGLAPEQWPSPIPEKMCGYAGGLGPDNISKCGIDIMRVAANPFWIDMESNIRTHNRLDIDKCISVLQLVDALSTLINEVSDTEMLKT